MEKLINLEHFANGALEEKFQNELAKVIANIYDPNTEAKKARKLSFTITFKPTSKRTQAAVLIDVKTSLVPTMPVETSIMIDTDYSTGEIVAAEIGNQIPGQMELDIDVPEKMPHDATVIDLKKANSK